jgi:CHAD domain-containing protein
MADALRAFRLTALRLRRGRHDAVRRVLNGTTFSGFDARLAELLASAETDPASEVPAAPDGDSAGPDGAAAAVEMPAAPAAGLPSPTDFARDTLRRRHRRLLKGLRRIGKLDGAARHELRLKTKKQRYAAGFLSKLFDPKAAAAYIQGAAAVQDALGLANDRLVATQVVADIRAAARPKGRLDWISGMLAGWLAMRAQAGGDDKALAAATKRLARAPRFWRGAARHHDGERQDERSG